MYEKVKQPVIIFSMSFYYMIIFGRRFWHFWSQIGVEESIGVGFIWIGVDPENSIFWHPQLHRGDVSEFFSLDSVTRDQYPIDFIRDKKNPWPCTRQPGDPYRDRVLK